MNKLRPYFLIFLGIAYLKYPSLSSAQTPILKTGTSFTTTELPYTTGQHTWPFEGGQLIMNSARYTNQTSWDVRNYTFYFKTKDEFYLVPIQKSGKTKSYDGINFLTENMGEDLISDCLIIRGTCRIRNCRGPATPRCSNFGHFTDICKDTGR